MKDLKSLLESEVKDLKSRVDELQNTCDYYKDEALRESSPEESKELSQVYQVTVLVALILLATGTLTQTRDEVMADPNTLLDQMLPLIEYPID